MQNNNLVLAMLMATLFILQACSPRIKNSLGQQETSTLSEDSKVYVLHNRDILPSNSKYIGTLKVGDTGFTTDCGYQTIMDLAKKEAQLKGANIIEITKFKKPNLASACYRLKANLYVTKDPNHVQNLEYQLTLLNKSELPEDAKHAVIHFYRPRYFPGSAIGYEVKINKGDVIGKIKNGSSFSYKTTQKGPLKIWTKDAEEYTTLDIQPGQEYYIKCSVKAGFPTAKPDISLIENELGHKEFLSMTD